MSVASAHHPTHLSPPPSLSLPLPRRVPLTRRPIPLQQLHPWLGSRLLLTQSRGGSIVMASASAPEACRPIWSDGTGFDELDEEADFDRVVSREGFVSICGFGSLLSGQLHFPNEVLMWVSCYRLDSFARDYGTICSRCHVKTIFPETLDGKPFPNPAVLCAHYSDEEFSNVRCKGSEEVYYQLYGRYGIDKIWRDDILPCRAYLRHWIRHHGRRATGGPKDPLWWLSSD